jgi:toxin ParE1/3/4
LSGLFETFDLLAARPGLAKNRPEIRPGIRSFGFKSHVILFVELADGIGIARVLHAARDIDTSPLGDRFPDQI